MDVQMFQHTEYARLERKLARRASTGSKLGDWLRLQREAVRLGLLSVGQELTLDQDFPGWRDEATS